MKFGAYESTSLRFAGIKTYVGRNVQFRQSLLRIANSMASVAYITVVKNRSSMWKMTAKRCDPPISATYCDVVVLAGARGGSPGATNHV